MTTSALWPLLLALVLSLSGCRRDRQEPAARGPDAGTAQALRIGLVIDIGGRGDHSFNDSGLRGLELWAAGKRHEGGRYVQASEAELRQSLQGELAGRDIRPIPNVEPVVLQSRAKEDYEPNVQLLVDQGVDLVIGVGFLLESAVEAVSKRHPETKFLLIDSPLLDRGKPFTRPNVRTIVFREEEGSFLVGALAGQVSRGGRIGFVGGMEIPLIRKFEAGFRAGVAQVNAKAASALLANYTGSFDNVATGKQVAQDLIAKGADVVFHAAGADGLGVIKAVEEARKAGKDVWAIGVDSDQWHLAKDAVLTSMVKRVDLAVYDTIRQLADGRFESGDHVWGLKEGGVAYAEVRVALPEKDARVAAVEALRRRVIDGGLKVPSNLEQLKSFKAAP